MNGTEITAKAQQEENQSEQLDGRDQVMNTRFEPWRNTSRV